MGCSPGGASNGSLQNRVGLHTCFMAIFMGKMIYMLVQTKRVHHPQLKNHEWDWNHQFMWIVYGIFLLAVDIFSTIPICDHSCMTKNINNFCTVTASLLLLLSFFFQLYHGLFQTSPYCDLVLKGGSNHSTVLRQGRWKPWSWIQLVCCIFFRPSWN